MPHIPYPTSHTPHPISISHIPYPISHILGKSLSRPLHGICCIPGPATLEIRSPLEGSSQPLRQVPRPATRPSSLIHIHIQNIGMASVGGVSERIRAGDERLHESARTGDPGDRVTGSLKTRRNHGMASVGPWIHGSHVLGLVLAETIWPPPLCPRAPDHFDRES